ncbi:MAG: 50S ribosomal protein L23 [Candidatus Komeilibacteria bacterium]|nr:50S ribosomal protein L23 [Candidatus Komeilibacteria bacterium]
MGLFDKYKKKSDKGIVQSGKVQDKKEMTLNELKQQAGGGAAASETTLAQGQAKAVKKSASENTQEAYRVLLHPLVTEKGSYAASQNKYYFAVNASANKFEIKKAIHALYGVSPVKVNVVSLPGKNVRYGKSHGRTSDQKKAIITLKKGETIQVYEGV